MAKLLAIRLYLLDRDLEIVGSEPVGPLSEKAMFHKDRLYRLFPTHCDCDDAPHVTSFSTAMGYLRHSSGFVKKPHHLKCQSPGITCAARSSSTKSLTAGEAFHSSGVALATSASSLDYTMTGLLQMATLRFHTLPSATLTKGPTEEVLADHSYLKRLFDVSQSALHGRLIANVRKADVTACL